MNFDGLSSLWLRNVTLYVLAEIARKAIREQGVYLVFAHSTLVFTTLVFPCTPLNARDNSVTHKGGDYAGNLVFSRLWMAVDV